MCIVTSIPCLRLPDLHIRAKVVCAFGAGLCSFGNAGARDGDFPFSAKTSEAPGHLMAADCLIQMIPEDRFFRLGHESDSGGLLAPRNGASGLLAYLDANGTIRNMGQPVVPAIGADGKHCHIGSDNMIVRTHERFLSMESAAVFAGRHEPARSLHGWGFLHGASIAVGWLLGSALSPCSLWIDLPQ